MRPPVIIVLVLRMRRLHLLLGVEDARGHSERLALVRRLVDRDREALHGLRHVSTLFAGPSTLLGATWLRGTCCAGNSVG